jgi:hypothetical protein
MSIKHLNTLDIGSIGSSKNITHQYTSPTLHSPTYHPPSNMKSTTILLAALSLLTPNLVHARKCTAGLTYCGYNLLKIGTSPTLPFTPPTSFPTYC